jgi:predicted dehydrogenase
MNRRQFLGAAAAGTVALGSRHGSSAADQAKLKLGLIGCGGYGMSDVRAAFKAGGVEVIAVCDVDSQHLADSATTIEKMQGSRPRTFKLYEELLETPELQAVIIATPPHWHALPFVAAVRKGLAIYCEKPLAYDIREAQAMVTVAQQEKALVQVGFQRRQSPAIRQVRDYLRQGQLGRIVQVDAQIHYNANPRDATPQDPPASLDWDLWCGPAPKIPYSPQVGHVSWRLEKTTGHGHLVDWGIHLIDATRWILGETMPRAVQASGGIYYYRGKITTPDVLSVQFDFNTCPVFWKHRIWGAQEYDRDVANGIFFYGENGTIFVTDNRWVVIPKDKDKQREEHKVAADMGTVHMTEFLQSVRQREQPSCTIEDGYQSTATVKLAMIAYDTGMKIAWDAKSRQIVGNPKASGLLKRPYRAPWTHPADGLA